MARYEQVRALKLVLQHVLAPYPPQPAAIFTHLGSGATLPADIMLLRFIVWAAILFSCAARCRAAWGEVRGCRRSKLSHFSRSRTG